MSNGVDTLAPWAVRYALGRMTYAVSEVVETLIAHQADLSENTRRVIIRDIDDVLDAGGGGMQMDRDAWRRLRAALDECE